MSEALTAHVVVAIKDGKRWLYDWKGRDEREAHELMKHWQDRSHAEDWGYRFEVVRMREVTR